jgi:hypothetical protein
MNLPKKFSTGNYFSKKSYFSGNYGQLMSYFGVAVTIFARRRPGPRKEKRGTRPRFSVGKNLGDYL